METLKTGTAVTYLGDGDRGWDRDLTNMSTYLVVSNKGVFTIIDDAGDEVTIFDNNIQYLDRTGCFMDSGGSLAKKIKHNLKVGDKVVLKDPDYDVASAGENHNFKGAVLTISRFGEVVAEFEGYDGNYVRNTIFLSDLRLATEEEIRKGCPIY